MKSIYFSSQDLPSTLSDKDRYGLWRESYAARFGPCEFGVSEGHPFQARIRATSAGDVNFAELSATLTFAERTSQNIAKDGTTARRMYINTGTALMGGRQLGREFVLEPGAAVLTSGCEPLRMYGGEHNTWMSVRLPENAKKLHHADDRESFAIDGGSEALTMLKRYIGFLKAGPPLVLPELLVHAADTIVDLVALAAGLDTPRAEANEVNGLRMARLLAIEEQIQRHFGDPAISAQTVAQELGLSARYVYELLHQSGLGFSERVMKLRLQRARAMLADRNNDHLRVAEIALICGFGDISHFNRNFRRQFGCTPTAAR